MSRKGRFILVAIGVLIIGLLSVELFHLFRSGEPALVDSPVPPSGDNLTDVVFPVEVAVARRGELIKRLNASGIIRARREVDLIARVGGEIVFLSAFNGKYAQQGELLVKLDDREHRIALERARAALLSAQIEYKSLISAEVFGGVDSMRLRQEQTAAATKFERAREQYRQGKLSEEEYVRLKRDYEAEMAYYSAQRGDLIANKSGLTQAQEAYERAKLNVEWTELRAPFSGYVANCELNERMQVQAGSVLLKLVDLSRLLVDVEVLETEIGKVKVGSKAEVRVNAYPEERFSGRVQMINPVVDAKSKTVRVTVEVRDAATKLRPGMFATVKLETEILRDRLLVPKEALLIRDQRPLVFVAQGGLAKWHYVEVGEENEELLEIRSGIAAGDTVIVGGHYTLAHDARIRMLK